MDEIPDLSRQIRIIVLIYRVVNPTIRPCFLRSDQDNKSSDPHYF